MSLLIEKLEEILKRYISREDGAELDLTDDDCSFRRFYFDSLPIDAAEEALKLFPNGDNLFKKYLNILKFKNEMIRLNDDELCDLVNAHLHNISPIMDSPESQSIVQLIDSNNKVYPAISKLELVPGSNVIHKHVYSAINEIILNELDDDDAYWILYDWSLEYSKWATVTAYFLSDYIDMSEYENMRPINFEAGFKLWCSRNNNNYWLENNHLSSGKIMCKPVEI
ncbi:hypothetical protein [uncultured Shewanella sp.]|uniref:hypothetical protein n=1 Tax=uncultured Shewanella sp. TaxID=173975 RepID=UPI00261ECC94|nr:hypothetical protein [uncultured Shewanella sp.]